MYKRSYLEANFLIVVIITIAFTLQHTNALNLPEFYGAPGEFDLVQNQPSEARLENLINAIGARPIYDQEVNYHPQINGLLRLRRASAKQAPPRLKSRRVSRYSRRRKLRHGIKPKRRA